MGVARAPRGVHSRRQDDRPAAARLPGEPHAHRDRRGRVRRNRRHRDHRGHPRGDRRRDPRRIRRRGGVGGAGRRTPLLGPRTADRGRAVGAGGTRLPPRGCHDGGRARVRAPGPRSAGRRVTRARRVSRRDRASRQAPCRAGVLRAERTVERASVVIISAPLLICRIVVACLTGAATAVRSVSRIWLRHWAEQRLRGAASAELYLERPQRLLLAAATGVAVTVYVAGALIGGVSAESLGVVAQRLVIFSIAVLVFGQLIPRAVARRWPTAVVPVLLPVLRVMEVVLSPFVTVAKRVVGWVNPRPSTPAEADRDDLEDLLRE